MRSHRFALATLLLGACAAAGCGSGKDTDSFMGSGVANTPVAATPAAPAPVVVPGAPDEAVLAERDKAQETAALGVAAAAKADKERKEARRELREEREKAERARKRAAAREAALRAALAEAAGRREAEQAAIATPRPDTTTADAPITGASTDSPALLSERDRRSAAEARAAIVRMHEMLGNRDVRACDLMTDRLLETTYGSAASARERCRTAVGSIDRAVSVTIAEARAHGRGASVAAVSRIGDSEVHQTFALVLVNGTWLIDGIERRPAA